jgi:rubrerythrin
MELDALFDIFKIAIDNEREAHEFYKKAAAGTFDPDAKKLFEDLASVELRHENLLQEKYRDMKERFSSPR